MQFFKVCKFKVTTTLLVLAFSTFLLLNTSCSVFKQKEITSIEEEKTAFFNINIPQNKNLRSVLKGKSLFYWKQFPKDQNKKYNASLLKKADTVLWSKNLWTTLEYPSKGYGTYRIVLNQKDNDVPLVLTFDKVLGAVEVWINGKKHGQLGSISKIEKEEILDGRPLSIYLPKEKKLDIMLLVSNHQHRLGGGFPLQNYIQTEQHFQTEQKTKPLLEGLMTLLIIFFGIYELYKFNSIKKEVYFLYFGLFCIVGASRQLFVGETLIYNFFPNISFTIVQKMRYIGYFGGLALVILYHFALFPNYLSKSIVKILYSIPILGAIYVLIMPVYYGTLIAPFFQFYGLFIVFIGVYLMLSAVKDKKPYARLILIIWVIQVLVFANDILNAMLIIQTKFLVNYGVTFYVMFQVYVNHKIQEDKEKLLSKLFLDIDTLKSDIDYKLEEIESLRKETFQQIKSKELLVDNLKKVVSNDSSISIQNIIANLKSELIEETQLLSIKDDIEVLNTEFIQRIKSIHPNLTKTDLEICSYLRMSLGRKEIARLRFTSVEAVKKSRNRLRKKMELTENIDLEEYLKSI